MHADRLPSQRLPVKSAFDDSALKADDPQRAIVEALPIMSKSFPPGIKKTRPEERNCPPKWLYGQ